MPGFRRLSVGGDSHRGERKGSPRPAQRPPSAQRGHPGLVGSLLGEQHGQEVLDEPNQGPLVGDDPAPLTVEPPHVVPAPRRFRSASPPRPWRRPAAPSKTSPTPSPSSRPG